MDEEQPTIILLSVKIYKWQRTALGQYQRERGIISLSEAIRQFLTEYLPKPPKETKP